MVPTILDRLTLLRTSCALVLVVLGGCRGEQVGALQSSDVQRLVDSLAPLVEQAVGLPFKEPPVSGLRSREDVGAYVMAKLNQELPPEKLARVQTAYRLFGLVPDSLELGPLITDLLSQQVVGYFDPDSAMLFVVEGSDPLYIKLVIAHELVHALQGQYMPLASLLKSRQDNDWSTALQSMLEGQANYASLTLLTDAEKVRTPAFWEQVRRTSQTAQSSLPPGLPLLLKEWLLFPYLGGGEFMRWWETSPLADTVPYGPRMPVSTEQILHPSRYESGDVPVMVVFADSTSDVVYQDNLGELEIRILLATLTGQDLLDSALPLGWGGDRYRVYRDTAGSALVWYTAWDTPRAAQRFQSSITDPLAGMARPGYLNRVEAVPLDGRSGVRVVIAPEAWSAWSNLPAAGISPAQ